MRGRYEPWRGRWLRHRALHLRSLSIPPKSVYDLGLPSSRSEALVRNRTQELSRNVRMPTYVATLKTMPTSGM